MIADPGTDASLRASLEQVLAIRVFAKDEIKLPAAGQFRYYVDHGRPQAVWNVYAAPNGTGSWRNSPGRKYAVINPAWLPRCDRSLSDASPVHPPDKKHREHFPGLSGCTGCFFHYLLSLGPATFPVTASGTGFFQSALMTRIFFANILQQEVKSHGNNESGRPDGAGG